MMSSFVYLFYCFEFWFLCVILAVLELRNLLVSASSVQELKAWSCLKISHLLLN